MVITERPVYATQPRMLESQIRNLAEEATDLEVEGDILGIIVPDTNRLSSSHVAASLFRLLKNRHYDTVILIASSHAGRFGRISICSVDRYTTPLGELVVDDPLRNELCDEDDDLYVDDRGHYYPCGIDVQLPFLQHHLGDFGIVPIVMGEESPEFCRELGMAVGEVMYNRNTLIVASADVLNANARSLKQFKEYFEAADVSRIMGLLNSEKVKVLGRGALLSSMIAALHRRANVLKVTHLEGATRDAPGYIGAVMVRY